MSYQSEIYYKRDKPKKPKFEPRSQDLFFVLNSQNEDFSLILDG